MRAARKDDLGGMPPDVPVGAAALAPIGEDVGRFLARLEAVAEAPFALLRMADAFALDALAVETARGQGAFEVAMGEGLDLLGRIGGDIRLGCSCLGDLARERLGIAASLARRYRRNAIALRARPLLRAAVLRGDVSPRKAEVVMRIAAGADEAVWVERARHETVRRLERLVGAPEHGDEDWHRLRLGLPRAQAEVVDAALEVAKLVLGPTAPLWKRIWAISAEYVGSHPLEPRERPAAAGAPRRTGGEPASATDVPASEEPGDGAERSTPPPVAAGDLADRPDPYAVLDALQRRVAERAAADERLGRILLLVRRLGLARNLGYTCFEEYGLERLGLAPSTARQRMWLERRMQVLPPLRDALRTRRLSYEQARVVARTATAADVAARIDDAAGRTCISLLRQAEAEEHRQMWSAGELRAVVPEDVGELVSDAIEAARRETPGITSGQAFVAVALHFVETWAAEAIRLVRGTHPVILRDAGLCQVPGCSLPAAHVHHTWFRSAGGPLAGWNEMASCLPHHLLGIHAGKILVSGRAPDGLTFVLGEKEVRAARGRCDAPWTREGRGRP
jgi:hypothetical protein